MTDGLHNLDAERSVLGAILLDEQHLATLTVDEHLLPEHFADPAHATVYRAVLDLQQSGQAIDYLTVAARLRDMAQLEAAGGQDRIEELTTWVPATGHVRDYGRLVRERHQARQLLAAAQQIQAEVTGRTAPIEQVIEHAVELVAGIAGDGRHGRRQHTWTPDQLRDETFDDLGQPTAEAWGTGFPMLDELLGGGLGRGELMLIAGNEKEGKSLLVDGLLEHLAGLGLSTHLYINEMSRRQRVHRMITRATGIPSRALKNRDLTPKQAALAADAMAALRVGITECQGWTASEIVRHIKRHRWDVCAVDIAHNIPKTEPGVAGWDAIAQELRTAPVQVDGLMLVAAHLKKRNTAAGEGLDVPVLDDIRDTGMFAKLADQVLFVARKRDRDGIPTSDGVLSLSAVRDGEPGLVRVTFQPARLRFVPALAVVEPRGVRADQYRPSPDHRIESRGHGEFEAGF